MKFIIGTKLNMTQVFDQEGNVHPVTVLKAGPVTVTQVKDSGKDGYSAVQIGFGDIREKLVAKPQRGHSKALGLFRTFKEFRVMAPTHKVGDKFDVSVFKEGDDVTVSSVSKGKGFQGAVKRHGFKGGSRTHGQKHSEREVGTISGAGRAGGRVAPGMRMAGRMGGDRVTVKNLKVVQINPTENLILVSGAIPGRKGTLVEVVTQ